MHIISAFVILGSLLPLASAHYRWTSLIANGTVTPAYQYVRQNTNYNSPVTDVKSADFTCNVGATTAPGTAWVKAGSTVGFVLDQAIFHHGPINVYMAKAPSTAASFNGAGTVWFKIAQQGAITDGGSTITWPEDNITQYTFTIPARVPTGDYLIRIEHIALHSASSYGGAQFYISCAQVHVYSGGTGTPSPLVAIPGVYTGYESSIMINIYYPIPPSYTNPGPAVWS